jgi:hypothetical protein
MMNSTITISSPSSTTGAIGSTGGYLISGSNGTSSWDYSSDLNATTMLSVSAGSNSLDVRGDANFQGDVKIKGVSIAETLDKINERLAILKPNPELESRWDRLRELRAEYQALEKECLEKEEIIRILEK